MAFCTNCGYKLSDGVRFCPDCGQAVAQAPGGPTATTPGSVSTAAGPQPLATPIAPAAPTLSDPPAVPTTPTPPPPPAVSADAPTSAAAQSRREEPQQEGLGGLAQRWLKTQFNVTLDPHQGRRNEAEARSIQRQMHRRVEENTQRAVADALIPQSWKEKMAEMERRREEGEAESARRRRAEHEARPRAQVQARLSGAVSGELVAAIPVRVGMPDEPGQPMTVELEPLEPIAIGDHAFLGLSIGVPAYAGHGTYELRFYEQRDDWDGSLITLMLDTVDEPLYWSADYGPGVIALDQDERTLRVRLAVEDSGSRHVDLDAVISLPQAPAHAG